MQINIKFYSFIKFETGLDEVVVDINEAGTIEDLIVQLEREYGDDLIRFIRLKDLNKIVALFVRDNNIIRGDEQLFDGDNIKIMPSVGGG